jgi:hypothetical protein
MPTLLTPPTTRPTTVTIDRARFFDRDGIIGAGDIIFGNALPRQEFQNSTHNGSMAVYVDADPYVPVPPSFSNHGIIWNYQPAREGRTGLADYGVVSVRGGVTNTGTIVVENADRTAYAVFAGGQSVNSGWIYGYSGQSNVVGYASEDPFGSLTNSGTIATHSPTAGAAGVVMDNGGTLHNQTGGIIQAAGANATAVVFNRGAYAGANTTYDPQIVNDGLIEAISLSPSRASVGLYLEHLEFEWMEVVNNGTIRADIAIFASGASFTPLQQSTDRITNSATGLIEGDIFLAEGDDILVNRGTIRGTVALGDGDDLFDTSAGTMVGLTDLGFGDDRFIGSAGSDFARGDSGADRLEGGSGNDLLIGDWGDDVLIGGAGNDGLYGEAGRDIIETAGGDMVSGGLGNDRVLLGDYRFAQIDGGAGEDTLVLAGTGRLLDLSAALGTGRLVSIERIELGAGDGLVVRAGNVAGLTNGGSALQIAGAQGGQINLVGAWSAAGTETVGGVTHAVYVQGNERVLVAAGLSVTIAADAPGGAVGLDAVASGDAAPAPGIIAGSELYSGLTFANFFAVRTPLVIDRSETWFSEDGNSVLALNDGAGVTNGGMILSASGAIPSANNGAIGFVQADLRTLGWFNGISDLVGSMAVYAFIGGPIDNSGLIVSEATKEGISVAIYVGSRGPLLNSGTIQSIAASGVAVGVRTYDAAFGPGPATFDNRGDLIVTSNSNRAIGVWTANSSELINSGRIDVSGGLGAYAVVTSGGGLQFRNEGAIAATTTSTGGDRSVAFYAWLSSPGTIVNSGTIVADELIVDYSSYGMNIDITNSGTITANITTNAVRDTITNSGLIDGDVSLGGGDDRYVNRNGRTTGLISGGAGTDTAQYGANFADVRIVETMQGRFTITGAFGTEMLSGFELLQFGDLLAMLDTGSGVVVDPVTADPDTFMLNIRDYDGNDLGGAAGWVRIGEADVNGDGDREHIFVNRTIGRFAEVAIDASGRIFFDNHGAGGDTRVVGIYIDPLVASGEVAAGSDNDSQRRFQNDLQIENISRVLGYGDYDRDGLQEVYFALTDGTAYLHAYMHADGNIRYANYQSQQQVIDFLTANGFGPSTWAGWFPGSAEAPKDEEDGGWIAEVGEAAGLAVHARSGHPWEGWMSEPSMAMAHGFDHLHPALIDPYDLPHSEIFA